MQYVVEVSKRAEADLDEIYADTFARWSRKQAEDWIRELKELIRSLSKMPLRFPIAPYAQAKAAGVRQAVHGRGKGRDRIYFKVRGSRVLVIAVRHSARDWIQ